MKTIFLIAISILIADFFLFGIFTPGFRPLPEVDGEYGQAFFKDKIDQHSYVRKPNVGRRDLSDQLYVFEIPKKDINEVVGKKTARELPFKASSPLLVEDIKRKLQYISRSLKKKSCADHIFSDTTKFYVEHAGGGDPFDSYVLVDNSNENNSNYTVVIRIPSWQDFGQKISSEIFKTTINQVKYSVNSYEPYY